MVTVSDLLGINFEFDPFGDPLAGLLDLDVPADQPASLPVHTVELDGLTITVIRIDRGGRQNHQLYAIDDTGWYLVADAQGLFVDALREIRLWRRYLAEGHTSRSGRLRIRTVAVPMFWWWPHERQGI